MPLPNISLNPNLTIKDGLEVSLHEGATQKVPSPQATRRSSVVGKRKAHRNRSKKRRKTRRPSVGTDASPFVFYPTPHPEQQKGYTYILNHTELVPLLPEAPNPVFWNLEMLKNMDHNSIELKEEISDNSMKNKKKEQVSHLKERKRKPPHKENNRRSSTFDFDMTEFKNTKNMKQVLDPYKKHPVPTNKWTSDRISYDGRKQIHSIVKGEKGRRYLVVGNDRYPIVPNKVKMPSSVGNHRTQSYVKRENNLNNKKKQMSTRNMNAHNPKNKRLTTIKSGLDKGGISGLFPEVEYGFIPTAAYKKAVDSYSRKPVFQDPQRFPGTKGGKHLQKKQTVSLSSTNVLTKPRLNYFDSKINESQANKASDTNMNNLKIMEYFRNKYKERTAMKTKLNSQTKAEKSSHSKGITIHVEPKFLKGSQGHQMAERRSFKESNLQALKGSYKESDVQGLKGINRESDGLKGPYKESAIQGLKIPYRKSDLQGLKGSYKKSVRTSEKITPHRGRPETGGTSGEGEEKVYVVYPASSIHDATSGPRVGRSRTSVFRGKDHGKGTQWGYWTQLPGDK